MYYRLSSRANSPFFISLVLLFLIAALFCNVFPENKTKHNKYIEIDIRSCKQLKCGGLLKAGSSRDNFWVVAESPGGNLGCEQSVSLFCGSESEEFSPLRVVRGGCYTMHSTPWPWGIYPSVVKDFQIMNGHSY